MITAIRIESGIARPTYWFLLKNALMPRFGRTAAALAWASTIVYGLVPSFTLVSSMFVRYSVIQLSMMPEMTSLTLQ